MRDLWNPPDAQHPAKVHLVGICGAGMKALAEYFADRGWQVSGSDGSPDRLSLQTLANRGISVHRGHDASHVPYDSQLLVYSPAVSDSNLERQAALSLNIPCLSYVDVLAELTRQATSIAIAGTHGKSTTTSMLGILLDSAQRSPTVISGGESRNRHANGWAGESSLLVVEACEFRRHFVSLSPQVACILGIEADHFDCFPDLNHTIEAYSDFIRRVPEQGTIIYRSDCEASRQALGVGTRQRISFSLNDPDSDWQAIEVTPDGLSMRFRLRHHQEVSRQIRLQVPGTHNVLNSVAAAACADAVGLSMEEIVTGIESYTGLKRRLERIRTWRGAEIIDDYAHHPTEIRAAISAVRNMFPGRKLICVFQSHQASRTKALLNEFAAALSLADTVYLFPIFAARETINAEHVSLSQKLQQQITSPTGWIASLDHLWGTLQTDADKDAVILTLGAGDLTRVHHDFID
ncbi:UDP-N-acetylmuramate--L-alanine ligase [Planctomicrobium sp. SH527]|uniref:UDP-N-acetylmuramate--L-alanine ligase n=1 Tax=Planctomicrobium sp. SH527 TaxID=3448123 RepID=UPI003F5B2DCD